MKLFLATAVTVCISCASAFVLTTTRPSSTVSSLNLFGDGGKGGNKGPGMMDQLAMFKKAQDMAAKKKKLDEELSKERFIGEGAGGKVKGSFQFVPIMNPLDPNPDYEAKSFEFDDEFFASASPEELSEAVKECVLNGIEKTNVAVAEKYSVLQSDLMAAFQGGPQKD
jgi:YbaB/EbfC DNA-binding family